MTRTPVRTSVQAPLMIAAIALICLSNGRADAMLPFYVQDTQAQLVNWSAAPPTVLDTELVGLIQKYAVSYLENGAYDNDEPYFANRALLQQSPHALGHYVFYGNLRYDGSPWVDVNRQANAIESNFYHANDPASLTAWRLDNGAVRLHWTPDLRFITHAEMRGMYRNPDYQIPVTKRIVRYIVTRHEPGSDVVLPPQDVPWDGGMDYDKDLFAYTDLAGSAAVSYSIQSVPYNQPDTAALDFGALLTQIRPAAEPHFWAVKRNYQESFYAAVDDDVAGATASVNWVLSFYVDRVLTEGTPNLVIRRLLEATRNAGGVEVPPTFVPLAATYVQATGEIYCTLATQVPDPLVPDKGSD